MYSQGFVLSNLDQIQPSAHPDGILENYTYNLYICNSGICAFLCENDKLWFDKLPKLYLVRILNKLVTGASLYGWYSYWQNCYEVCCKLIINILDC